jgi:hypothetical protein
VPATQEAEIRRITVQSQPRQIVCQTLSRKNLLQERAGGVVQGVALSSRLNTEKKKKRSFSELVLFLAGEGWDLNPGPCTCQAGLLLE